MSYVVLLQSTVCKLPLAAIATAALLYWSVKITRNPGKRLRCKQTVGRRTCCACAGVPSSEKRHCYNDVFAKVTKVNGCRVAFGNDNEPGIHNS